MCLRCGRIWRTQSMITSQLEDLKDGEINISPGIAGYAAAMERFGREPFVRSLSATDKD